MVRLPTPPKTHSNFLSIKGRCIALLKLSPSPTRISQIHAQIQVSGLHQDPYLVPQLVRICCSFSPKQLTYARTLLHHSLISPPISWNLLIRGYSASDSPLEAIRVFHRMRREGVRPNKLTFPFLLNACASGFAIGEGKQVHADVIKYGLDCDVYVNNNLVFFYGTCKKITDAVRVFDEMPLRSLVSWNVVITTCVENLWFADAIEYFGKMRNYGLTLDTTTMVVMLSLCGKTGNLSLGRFVHSQVIKGEMVVDSQLGTALVDMYAKSGNLDYAKKVFDRMEEKNVWSWSAMILGLAQHGFALEGLELFHRMMKTSSIRPNHVTFLGVLCACSHTGLVDDGFSYFLEMQNKHGIKPRMEHYGAMVDILGRAGRLRDAHDFIMHMPVQPDPSVWRILLGACSVHNVNGKDGIADEVEKKLLKLEPRRSGNLIMVANMYADTGQWEEAANIRRFMRESGLKKTGGESCVELSGSLHHFFSGYSSQKDHQAIYYLLHGLNLHMKKIDNASCEL